MPRRKRYQIGGLIAEELEGEAAAEAAEEGDDALDAFLGEHAGHRHRKSKDEDDDCDPDDHECQNEKVLREREKEAERLGSARGGRTRKKRKHDAGRIYGSRARPRADRRRCA